MATLLNTTSATILVTDVYPSITWAPNTSAVVPDSMLPQSSQIAQQMATGALVLTSAPVLPYGQGPLVFTYHASNLETASNASPTSFTVLPFSSVRVYLNVTQVSGTLTVSWQESPDGGTTWYPATQLWSVTASGLQTPQVINPGDTVRFPWTISSGGSATFAGLAIARP